MYCRKCGNIIPDDSLFCNRCGTEVSNVNKTIAERNVTTSRDNIKAVHSNDIKELATEKQIEHNDVLNIKKKRTTKRFYVSIIMLIVAAIIVGTVYYVVTPKDILRDYARFVNNSKEYDLFNVIPCSEYLGEKEYTKDFYYFCISDLPVAFISRMQYDSLGEDRASIRITADDSNATMAFSTFIDYLNKGDRDYESAAKQILENISFIKDTNNSLMVFTILDKNGNSLGNYFISTNEDFSEYELSYSYNNDSILKKWMSN
ncbi:MAG: zinc ribbon domain-containing protein [Oscillospiraceae bacterium]|nr:zinc ribbon domain-containing protein [Oscillospiraceae bacterium]